MTFEPTYEESLVEEHGNRATKAIRLAESGKVKHYLEGFCVVEGDHSSYAVTNNGNPVCTCPAYQFNQAKGLKCSHILAVEVARKRNYLVWVNKYWSDVVKL
jgi:predicted nucleic acid-binding Zn finger protein